MVVNDKRQASRFRGEAMYIIICALVLYTRRRARNKRFGGRIWQ